MAGETVLRVRTGTPIGNSLDAVNEPLSEVEVTTWKLPMPRKTLEKWEGGVLAQNGVMYCMPNNHKAVLQIVPVCVPSRDELAKAIEEREMERTRVREIQKQRRQEELEKKKAEKALKKEAKKAKAQSAQATKNPFDLTTPDGIRYKYSTGIATLRSSAHRVKYSLEHRKHDPNPVVDGKCTNTTFLPAEICEEDVFAYDTDEYDFHGTVVDMLEKCDPELIGHFRSLEGDRAATESRKLDNFVVPLTSLTRKCQKGKVEQAQQILSDKVASDSSFLALFDRFLENAVLPHLKQRLVNAGAVKETKQPVNFYYQRPPTMRIQPGPARALVRAHNDAEYGHQNGELNYWLPLTSRRKTGVDLWVESSSGKGDFHQLRADFAEVASFHGSSCSHYINANHSLWTRVSLDFRVGIEGFFDPNWQMIGTTDDHSRKKVTL